MTRRARLRSSLSTLLDALATRVGLSLSLCGLVFLCTLAGLRIEQSFQELQQQQKAFNERQLRNTFISMSDIQRLMFVMQRALAEGSFSTDLEGEFTEAVDFIFVRRDDFVVSLEAGDTPMSAAAAIASFDNIIQIADNAVLSGLDDVSGLWAELVDASDDARRALAVFFDETARIQIELVNSQSRTLGEQRAVVSASLIGLTFVGIAALLLLRREVLTRKARERAERSVEFLAYNDPLTGLPNRVQFHTRLEERLQDTEPVTLVLVDLDDFKGINDTYGHAAGDAVLRHVGALLNRLAQEWDGFAARLGGDEFAVVVETDDTEGLTGSCERLLRQAKAGLSFEGERLKIGMSAGFAISTTLGENLEPSVDTICRVADFALYSSKSNGRGLVTPYDESLEHLFRERREMVETLPSALANGDLEVYLQPKVRLPERDVYGFEALLRWPKHGVITPPDEFIRIAEESGLIFDVDKYVLDRATMAIGQYNLEHGTEYSVSVNLSALHFTSERIVNWVREVQQESALDPGLLTVEITETAEMRDLRSARQIMSEIRALGVKISIDDFGKGYSSLGYLRSTMVDELKIDRSIIEQIDSSDEARYLLDGILDIASNLGLSVVVEGVEEQAQADTVTRMGAKRAQGFLFGKPMPAAEALDLAGATQHRERSKTA